MWPASQGEEGRTDELALSKLSKKAFYRVLVVIGSENTSTQFANSFVWQMGPFNDVEVLHPHAFPGG